MEEFSGGGGGETRAIGSPRFVTNMDSPVVFTCSRIFKQVALNSEIEITNEDGVRPSSQRLRGLKTETRTFVYGSMVS